MRGLCSRRASPSPRPGPSAGGRRRLGARAKDFKAGKALSDLVRQKVPSSTPQLACHDPEPKRTLIIDSKTGDLEKFELPEGYGQN